MKHRFLVTFTGDGGNGCVNFRHPENIYSKEREGGFRMAATAVKRDDGDMLGWKPTKPELPAHRLSFWHLSITGAVRTAQAAVYNGFIKDSNQLKCRWVRVCM